MTRLISLSLAWLLFASCAPSAFSQTVFEVPTLQQLNQQLHLTQEQKERLAPILEQQEQKLRALVVDQSLTQLQKVPDFEWVCSQNHALPHVGTVDINFRYAESPRA